MLNLKTTSGLLVLALAGMTSQAAAPSLSYEVNGNELIINYTGTLLQSTDAVHWTEVAFASSPYKVALNDKQLFFCAKGETSKKYHHPAVGHCQPGHDLDRAGYVHDGQSDRRTGQI